MVHYAILTYHTYGVSSIMPYLLTIRTYHSYEVFSIMHTYLDFESRYIHNSMQAIRLFGASCKYSLGREFYSEWLPLCHTYLLTILTYGIVRSTIMPDRQRQTLKPHVCIVRCKLFACSGPAKNTPWAQVILRVASIMPYLRTILTYGIVFGRKFTW